MRGSSELGGNGGKVEDYLSNIIIKNKIMMRPLLYRFYLVVCLRCTGLL